MRAIFSTLPGLGHFHPMVPLAKAMAAAGHEVAFATSSSFCPAVAGLGWQTFAAGRDWEESDAAATLPELLHERPDGQIRIFVGLAATMADDLVRIASKWGADTIVREPTEFGGWVAAERLGIPHVTHGIMIRLPGFALNMMAGPQFADLLAAQGLPPDPELDGPYRHLYLDFMPPSFVPDGWPMAPTVHQIRPEPFDASGPEDLPAWTTSLGSRPVVYATLGTVFNDAPATFRAIIDGLAGEDLDLVVTLGKNGDPDRLGPQASNVHLERYIPQSQLLSLCDAVICHAGYGTIMGAVTNGLPVLCLPTTADQCFGAQRCADLGLGLSLATHYVPGEPYPFSGPGDIDAERVRQAVRSLLDDPKHRAAAERVKVELATMPDVNHAVGLVEGLVAGRG